MFFTYTDKDDFVSTSNSEGDRLTTGDGGQYSYLEEAVANMPRKATPFSLEKSFHGEDKKSREGISETAAAIRAHLMREDKFKVKIVFGKRCTNPFSNLKPQILNGVPYFKSYLACKNYLGSVMWSVPYMLEGTITLLPIPDLLGRFPCRSNGPSGPLYSSENIDQRGSLLISVVPLRTQSGYTEPTVTASTTKSVTPPQWDGFDGSTSTLLTFGRD